MDRFASAETDVDRNTRLSIDAERAMLHNETFRHGSPNGTSDNTPTTSARILNAIGRTVGSPGKSTDRSEAGEVHLGAAAGAEGAVELMEDVPKERQIYVEVCPREVQLSVSPEMCYMGRGINGCGAFIPTSARFTWRSCQP